MVQSVFDLVHEAVGFWFGVVAFVVLGVVLLKYGADGLVNGASNIGLRLGMSATLTGLTIVAFGTSAPELVVSVVTAAQGQPEICLGNVIGSNIANTGLILGGTAIVTPLFVPTHAIRTELLLSFLSMLVVWIFALSGFELGRIEGLLLLAGFALWMGLLIRSATRTSATTRALGLDTAVDVPELAPRSLALDIGLVLVGLTFLVFGADALVVGAVETARALAVPEVVVGLTVVAGGTSLPEFAVCLVAAFRRQAEITLGNILGSNIFNALLILGVACVIEPIGFGPSNAGARSTLWIDIPVCLVLTGVLIPLLFRNGTLTRRRGAFLVSAYVAYIVWLILRQI